MADKSLEQHQSDVDEKLGHIEVRGSSDGENGACLNRHTKGAPKDDQGLTCSHRWQAYLQMKGDPDLYNWDAYDSLCSESPGKNIRTDAYKKDGQLVPSWYAATIAAPKKGEWNIGEKADGKKLNFWEKCYAPYWHEAHHIVPNSTLREALSSFAKAANVDGLLNKIRSGLLKEKYNLNKHNNMIMLPMDKKVSDSIGLPRHRKRPQDFHHGVFSKHVKGELESIFSALKQEIVEHEKPKYKNLKRRIETLSENLYKQIKGTGRKALDTMRKSEFTGQSVPVP